jgi:lipopolysaccharide transport system permease protein
LTTVQTPAVLRIRPPQRWVPLNLRELWSYRHLLYLLAWRDVTIRYKRTILGGAWAVLQPLLMMLVFAVVFGRLGRFPSQGLPYPMFLLVALLPWQLFAGALSRTAMSTVGNANLLTKVYFPRLLIPFASAATALVDFVAAFLVLVGALWYYGVTPGWTALNVVWITGFALATGLAFGLWLAALNVKYRDFGNAVPFLMQLWLYLTPVLYPSTMIPPRWRTLLGLNPMATVVDGFRWALLGLPRPTTSVVLTSVALVTVLLLAGLYFFRSLEYEFADVV